MASDFLFQGLEAGSEGPTATGGLSLKRLTQVRMAKPWPCPTVEIPFPEANMKPTAFDLLGIRIHALSERQLLDAVARVAKGGAQYIIGNHNLHSLYMWFQEPRMREFYSLADYTHLDGMSVVLLRRLQGLALKREAPPYLAVAQFAGLLLLISVLIVLFGSLRGLYVSLWRSNFPRLLRSEADSVASAAVVAGACLYLRNVQGVSVGVWRIHRRRASRRNSLSKLPTPKLAVPPHTNCWRAPAVENLRKTAPWPCSTSTRASEISG